MSSIAQVGTTGTCLITPDFTFLTCTEKIKLHSAEDPSDFFLKQSVNRQEQCYSRPALETN